MRIFRYQDQLGKIGYAAEKAGGSPVVLKGMFPGPFEATSQAAEVARVLAPVDPVNIFCIGQNYADHVKEFGGKMDERPALFMKPTTTVCGPDDAIRLPRSSPEPEVDYEAELALVIGREVRDASPERALDAVFGYTCANDVSARWWQHHAGARQWIRGKGFDTFCPLGPVMVTADEIPDPQALTIRSRVNGRTMQEDRTSNMVFGVAELIAYLSTDVTLKAGTLILTGTPSGVGAARQPPIFLKSDDVVEIEIERIGTLSNPVAEAE